MQIRFGASVFEHGRRVGRVAGLEIDPMARRAVRIVYSPSGTMTNETHTRWIGAIDASSGRLMLLDRQAPMANAATNYSILSRSTRVVTEAGKRLPLSGIEFEDSTGALKLALGRRPLWLGHVRFAISEADLTIPGEIRMRGDRPLSSAHAKPV